jgi:hypothetical protein
MIEAIRAQFPKYVYLQVKNPYGLLKDPGPKKHPNS